MVAAANRLPNGTVADVLVITTSGVNWWVDAKTGEWYGQEDAADGPAGKASQFVALSGCGHPPWPISVGSTWTQDCTYSSGQTVPGNPVRFEVTGIENVTGAGGTFESWHVVDSYAPSYLEWWYAPGVCGHIVDAVDNGRQSIVVLDSFHCQTPG